MLKNYSPKNLWKFQHELKYNDRKLMFQSLKTKKQTPWYKKETDCISNTFKNQNILIEKLSHFISIISTPDIEILKGKPFPREDTLALSFMGQDVNLLQNPTVAIIGSRHPTQYGRKLAYRFGHALASQGFLVLSGGAIGIDTEALDGALSSPLGRVAVVLGSGLNALYPHSNQKLFHSIVQEKRGILLSEFGENEKAAPWRFPVRNKTIAALSDFVLIIECTVPSGTLTTVQAAATYGVDVGATPGPIGSPLSQGPHQIISLGAQCITHPLDVVAQFGPLLQRPKPSKHNPIK